MNDKLQFTLDIVQQTLESTRHHSCDLLVNSIKWTTEKHIIELFENSANTFAFDSIKEMQQCITEIIDIVPPLVSPTTQHTSTANPACTLLYKSTSRIIQLQQPNMIRTVNDGLSLGALQGGPMPWLREPTLQCDIIRLSKQTRLLYNDISQPREFTGHTHKQSLLVSGDQNAFWTQRYRPPSLFIHCQYDITNEIYCSMNSTV